MEGKNAYGVRARGQAGSDQAASIELTNGVIEARSHGDTAIAAYSASGDIGLKGTTAITATAAAPGKKVESIAKRMIKYLLFARSHEIWQREIL